MPVLYRELAGGHLIPRLQMTPRERWTATVPSQLQLVQAPRVDGDWALRVTAAAGQTQAAWADTELNLSGYDGVALFTYAPAATFLGTARVRLYTTYPDSYYEASWTPHATSGAPSGALYGSALYGVSRYSTDPGAPQVTTWERRLWRWAELSRVGTPSPALIRRVEVQVTALTGGQTDLYVDAFSGWVEAAPEEASANREMSFLPEYHWDQRLDQLVLQATGYQIDGVRATARYGLDQRLLTLAEWGLRLHELERGLAPEPPAMSEARRRAHLLTMTRQPTTTAEIAAAASAVADGAVTLTEVFSQYRVDAQVAISDLTATRDRVLVALRRMIPAHLQVVVSYQAFVAGLGRAGGALGAVPIAPAGETVTTGDAGSAAVLPGYTKAGRGVATAVGHDYLKLLTGTGVATARASGVKVKTP
jgi:hypothetical protein